MILICGLLADTMIELMCARLIDMGYEYLFFDERDYPGRCQLTWEIDGCAVSGHVETPEGRVALGDLSGVYARYVDYRDDSRGGGLNPQERLLADSEYQSSVMNLLDLLPCTVINRPKASMSNDSKVFQGGLAVSCGLMTPRTLVTTDADEAVAFYEACDRRVIFKSLSSVRSIVRPLAEADLPRLARLRDCPTQFQETIVGVDIRVHTVGDELFPAEIVSEASDYRYARAQGASVEGRAVILPPEISDSCLRLARGLGLELSGIDLRRTPEGRYYCFEINPSPGFIYFERLTGQPDTKDQKDQKDPKEAKDQKDQKDPKEAKDHKELVDNKGRLLLEKIPTKDSLEKLPEIVKEPSEGTPAPVQTTGLEELIKRVTGLEGEVKDLKSKGAGPAK